MKKQMHVWSMLLCVLVASLGGLVSEAGATVLLQTGFDSSEGWVEGQVTVAPNPPAGLGTWSHYGSTSQAAHIDLDPQTFVAPSSGDGLLYVDRVGKTSASEYIYDALVGGWADNQGGTTVDVTVDMQVPVGSTGEWVVVALGKRANGGVNDGFQVASLITWPGGVFAYKAGTSGWITTTAPAPRGQWQNVHMIADNATKTWSAYVGGIAIIENVPYRNQSGIPGDDVVRGVGFGLGGPSRGYFDNLVVQGVPEPATLVVLTLGLLGMRLRRR